jgi:hypothetical protein
MRDLGGRIEMVENVEQSEIWADDLLGRELDAALLYNFIINRMKERKGAGKYGSYVMNIDAEWGQGKSFFLERFYQQVLDYNHPAVFINAWRDDFSDDPFTSVLSEFTAYISEFKSKDEKTKSRIAKTLAIVKRNAGKIMWVGARGVAGKLVEKAVGGAKGELVELLTEASPATAQSATEIVEAGSKALTVAAGHVIDDFADRKIVEFNSAKESIVNFEASFSDIVQALEKDGKRMPFFIFVDELDRCRPTYAISMLERIKHLFDVENVVFLIATDTDQLCEAIKAVYGQGFGSRKYLSRFFNRPYVLPTPDRYKLVQAILSQYNLDPLNLYLPFGLSDHAEVIVTLSEHYGLDIRQLEHAIDILASIATTWREPIPVDLLVIFPLIIGVLEKQSLNTHDKKMAMFTRANKAGQPLMLSIQSVPLGNKLPVAAWASNYLAHTNNTTLQGAMRELGDKFNNNSGHNPILMEVYRRVEAEHNLRGKNKLSLIANYVDIIQSMRSFTGTEDAAL